MTQTHVPMNEWPDELEKLLGYHVGTSYTPARVLCQSVADLIALLKHDRSALDLALIKAQASAEAAESVLNAAAENIECKPSEVADMARAFKDANKQLIWERDEANARAKAAEAALAEHKRVLESVQRLINSHHPEQGQSQSSPTCGTCAAEDAIADLLATPAPATSNKQQNILIESDPLKSAPAQADTATSAPTKPANLTPIPVPINPPIDGHDMLVGACACGAWHQAGDWRLRDANPLSSEERAAAIASLESMMRGAGEWYHDKCRFCKVTWGEDHKETCEYAQAKACLNSMIAVASRPSTTEPEAMTESERDQASEALEQCKHELMSYASLLDSDGNRGTRAVVLGVLKQATIALAALRSTPTAEAAMGPDELTPDALWDDHDMYATPSQIGWKLWLHTQPCGQGGDHLIGEYRTHAAARTAAREIAKGTPTPAVVKESLTTEKPAGQSGDESGGEVEPRMGPLETELNRQLQEKHARALLTPTDKAGEAAKNLCAYCGHPEHAHGGRYGNIHPDGEYVPTPTPIAERPPAPTCKDMYIGLGADQAKSMGIPCTDELLSEWQKRTNTPTVPITTPAPAPVSEQPPTAKQDSTDEQPPAEAVAALPKGMKIEWRDGLTELRPSELQWWLGKWGNPFGKHAHDIHQGTWVAVPIPEPKQPEGRVWVERELLERWRKSIGQVTTGVLMSNYVFEQMLAELDAALAAINKGGGR